MNTRYGETVNSVVWFFVHPQSCSEWARVHIISTLQSYLLIVRQLTDQHT